MEIWCESISKCLYTVIILDGLMFAYCIRLPFLLPLLLNGYPDVIYLRSTYNPIESVVIAILCSEIQVLYVIFGVMQSSHDGLMIMCVTERKRDKMK